MAMRIALLILLLATPVVYGVQHTVGGSAAWSLSGDYTTWAASQTFRVGDTLLFTYTSSHSVDVVSKANYDSCSSANPISHHQGGSTTITLSSPGWMYFLCPTPGHCAQGMKLAVDVMAANATSATPSPSGSPPSTTTSPPPPPGKSTGTSLEMNGLMFGFSIVIAAMFAFMG